MKSESEMIEKAVGQEVACGLEGEVCGMKQRLEDRYFGGGTANTWRNTIRILSLVWGRAWRGPVSATIRN